MNELTTSKRSLRRWEARKLPKYLPAEKVNAIIEATKKKEYYSLFLFLWHTGARISEALAVKVDDIDFVNKKVRISTLKRKAKMERILPIDEGLATVLSLHITSDKLTYNDRLWDMSTVAVFLYLKRVCAKIGLPSWIHPHTFRHSFAVNCLKQGVSLPTLKTMLGHASIENTMIYLQLTQPDMTSQMKNVTF